MALESLQELYVEQLKDLHSAEEQIIEALPKMIEKASHAELRQAFEAHLEEGEETLKERADSDVLDAALIAAAQRVEHYEMAGYGCARTYAHLLGLDDDVKLLQQTLDEEGDTDHLLTDLAERVINIDALTGDRQVGRGVERKADAVSGSSSSSRRSRTTDSEAKA